MPYVVVTEDGSHTVALDHGVTYHSMRGAINESTHVYIRHGLEYLALHKNEISILEVGFGTGLNAFLTFLFSIRNPTCRISYHGIEKFPLSPEITDQLNYLTCLHAEPHADIFRAMHRQSFFDHDHFSFHRTDSDIWDFSDERGQFNLVYFDAFGPGDQAEMWDLPLLQHIYMLMRPKGVLVTFCAQGQFKRNLKSTGFVVESVQGPKGKREMTRASKDLS